MNKNTIISGIVCGIICVVFMWIYMSFTGNDMSTQSNSNTHMMPNGQMMMNANSSMSMDSMMMDMLAGMRGKSGKDLEKAFITEMIPHHQGAVDMAKMLLKDPSINSDLKAFAENIINAQESEILQMNTWLKNY